MATYLIIWNEAKEREEAVKVSGSVPVIVAENRKDALAKWEGEETVNPSVELNSLFVNPYTGEVYGD